MVISGCLWWEVPMPDTATIENPRPDSLPPAFMDWTADVDAARGLQRLIDRRFCFRCEQYTLVAAWCGDALVLSCPCRFRPVAIHAVPTTIHSPEEDPMHRRLTTAQLDAIASIAPDQRVAVEAALDIARAGTSEERRQLASDLCSIERDVACNLLGMECYELFPEDE